MPKSSHLQQKERLQLKERYSTELPRSTVFRRIAMHLDSVLQPHDPAADLTIYSSQHDAPIDLAGYLDRFRSVLTISKEAAVVACCYMDKLLSLAKVALTKRTCQRLWLASLLLGHKYMDEDSYLGMGDFAMIAGVTRDELWLLEEATLKTMEYRLNLTRLAFDTALAVLAADPVAQPRSPERNETATKRSWAAVSA